ncbi:alpha/beta fold hydrolase [Bacillus sp. NPDC094106]|uniref:alpha/beta fold hydrolase n=1 Tax=Bacillus sp. NPDC094106 TaxID=3363949 RepID=UPI003801BBE4
MKHIVFIPGVMGSELIEGNMFGGTKRWFTLRESSAKRLKIIDGKKDKIRPGSPIEYGVRIFGSTVKKSIVYADIIRELSNLNKDGCQFHPYGYDWRKDLWQTCEDLHRLLKQFGKEEVYIVAHSMGGLLAHTYVQWAHEKKILPNIKKVITIGTPWQGSPDAVKALNYGVDDKGRFFPSAKTTREIARTFPSSYQLLPSARYCLANNFLTNQGRALRWLECMDYVEGLNGCSIKSVYSLNKKIHQSLSCQWPQSIEHYNVIGVNQGTLGVLRLGENGRDRIGETVDGDGTVPLNSAIPPFNCKEIVYAHASHGGLVLHDSVLKWITNLLEKGKVESVAGVETSYIPRTDWIMDKIDCPVEVKFEGEEESVNKPFEDITRHTIGEATYLIYNKLKPINIEVEAYDEGRTEIETISFVKGRLRTLTKFPSLDADPSRKTIIKTKFEDDKPITKVYTAGEVEEEQVIEVTGITVDVPEDQYSEPPRTRVYLKPKGKGESGHFDDLGIKVTFKVNKSKFEHLETRYRVNNGNWRRYENEIHLTLDNGLVNGKNLIEYYSLDVLDNEEEIRKRVFYIESKPKIFYKVQLNPDFGGTLSLEEYYEGVRKYKYSYRYDGATEHKYQKPIKFKPFEKVELLVQAEDMFGRKTSWIRFNQGFSELVETIWSEDGFNGTINDVVSLLSEASEQSLVSVYINKVEKNLYDVIPKSAKILTIRFEDIEYIIDLMPKLEVYLDFHSQIINRQQENVKISFLIYDAEGDTVKGIEPSVKYTLMPTLNKDLDVFYSAISSNGKGVYSFNVPVGHLSKEVKKIRFEFRDAIARMKPLETHIFKVE